MNFLATPIPNLLFNLLAHVISKFSHIRHSLHIFYNTPTELASTTTLVSSEYTIQAHYILLCSIKYQNVLRPYLVFQSDTR